MQLVNFSTVATEGLKVLEESRKEGQDISVSSIGHQKLPNGHLLWLAGISNQHKPTMYQPILRIRRLLANNNLAGSFQGLFAKKTTEFCDTCSQEGD